MEQRDSAAANEQDWTNTTTSILPSSFLQGDAGTNGIGMDWFLPQSSTSRTEVMNEHVWEDFGTFGQPLERRLSQGSLWDGSTRSASVSKTRGIKRRRLNQNSTHTSASLNQAIPYQARQRALKQISTCGWKDGCLAEMESFVCEDLHCFALEPMGKDPRGYSGEPLRREKFDVRIIEPPGMSQRLHMIQYPPQSLPIARQIGRSLHLIVAKYPNMSQPQSLESGFALLVVCRKAESSEQWSPLCLAGFTGMTHTTKATSDSAHFVANLDRCKKVENGKRIWGERTSHVKHDRLPAKPVRIEPRGASRSFLTGDHYCIVVTLHDPQGRLLVDVDDLPCIAQSNPFFFESKTIELASQTQKLLEHLEKHLSEDITCDILIFGRVRERKKVPALCCTTADCNNHDSARQMLLSNSHETQRAAGIYIGLKDNKLPPTACALEDFNLDFSQPISQQFIDRLQAVASYMGQKHANVDLTDKNIRYLRTQNGAGAEGRYLNLQFGGMMDKHEAWLCQNDISIRVIDTYNRTQILQSIMFAREYRSHWIICVADVFPPEVMVDREDSSKVYSLMERSGSGTLDLADRLYPLARLAYCSRLPRSLIKQVLMAPYIRSFEEAGRNGTEEEKALDEEKFWLILHAIFLEYFLYWTELRNALSCKRIEQRLLEDDFLLNDKFFGDDKMHRFRNN